MTYRHRTLHWIAALLLTPCALLLGCGDDAGGAVDPYPAPDFTLQDLNPGSPSYLEDVSPSDASNTVVVLYFASFT